VGRRWPAGLHLAAGSLPAAGQRPRRPPTTPQHHYWRHTETELHAAAGTVPLVIHSGVVPSISASTGPTAAGETWSVDMAQVQINQQHGNDPLVVQQIEAQTTGSVTAPPPPITAQVWLSVAGVNVHLLAQTSQGGYDNVGLGGQEVRPGEAITVVWWLAEPFGAVVFTTGWFTLRGTRHTLSQL
jgi:hypothetical protein